MNKIKACQSFRTYDIHVVFTYSGLVFFCCFQNFGFQIFGFHLSWRRLLPRLHMVGANYKTCCVCFSPEMIAASRPCIWDIVSRKINVSVFKNKKLNKKSFYNNLRGSSPTNEGPVTNIKIKLMSNFNDFRSILM